MSKSKQYIYFFSSENKQNIKKSVFNKDILGGKGFNLLQMCKLGVPVPPGFTITTDICKYYHKKNEYPASLKKEVKSNIEKLEKLSRKKLGDAKNPMLVSVRSGAPISMPGMMDTLLNLGLNDETVSGLIEKTNNPRFALDSYRRFIQMFGNIVLKINMEQFEHILESVKQNYNFEKDTDLQEEHLKIVIANYKKLIKKLTGKPFQQDVWQQLNQAIDAVVQSWMNPRAIAYRKFNNIHDSIGTAINVQLMAFGNMGETSGTGVAFTRNPATGEKKIFGEFLMNAQGEDVVAGIRTPFPIDKLKEILPKNYNEFIALATKLENYYKDMQDIEFTIEEKKLYILQTRNAKRTSYSEINTAFDFLEEKKITEKELLQRIHPNSMSSLLTNVFSEKEEKLAIRENKVVGVGLPACPGAACGKVATSIKKVEELVQKKESAILVTTETSPEDISGMHYSQGILTARGGMTSHAAVVARGMNKTCVVSCSNLEVDSANKRIIFYDKEKQKKIVIKEGETISINGTTGNVMQAELTTQPSEIERVLIDKKKNISQSPLAQRYKRILDLSKKHSAILVRSNADNGKDASVSRDYGADGIGLCRTEHMFFEGKRIINMREMILAESVDERRIALKKLLKYQIEDFKKIFKTMDGLPVTIRLLDPPLHEFLPHEKEHIKNLAQEIGKKEKDIIAKVRDLEEKNPMLGHRGCRLGISYPEITEMQTRAIIEAACIMQSKGVKVFPEIMIPLVGNYKELENQKNVIQKIANEIMQKKSITVPYLLGTMIEVPRAAVTASQIAEHADFFSFGTNDLTQLVSGFSRDDSYHFLTNYQEKGIYKENPFQVLDEEGVGSLIKVAIENGKKSNPKIKLGVCGEHGGDPKSIHFCVQSGLHYVSCSPYRVPSAILAAAQSSILLKKKKS